MDVVASTGQSYLKCSLSLQILCKASNIELIQSVRGELGLGRGHLKNNMNCYSKKAGPIMTISTQGKTMNRMRTQITRGIIECYEK